MSQDSELDSHRLTDFTKSSSLDHRKAIRRLAARLEDARGRGNAISSKDLAKEVEVSASTVRDLIPIIRREYSLPITYCNDGYYLIISKAEMKKTQERIKSEIATRRRTLDEIEQAFGKVVE